MSSKILGLRTVGYKVTDLNAATQWYTEAFENTSVF